MGSTLKLPKVIEPNKCILEDFEIIAFEKEEELDYYSYWNDRFRCKSIAEPIQSQQPPQQQRQQQQRQQQQRRRQQEPSLASLDSVYHKLPGPQKSAVTTAATTAATTTRSPVREKRSSTNQLRQQQQQHQPQPQQQPHQPQQQHQQPQQQQQISPTLQPRTTALLQVPKSGEALTTSAGAPKDNAKDYTPRYQPTTPGNGLAILNSSYYNTLPDGKVLMKYKLTKLYNKFRGRQTRRTLVAERQMAKRLKEEIDKSRLNSWITYTALQALRLPESNLSQLSTIAINNNPRFITIPQMNQNPNGTNSNNNSKSSASPKKNANSKKQQATPQPQSTSMAPMHLVYIDPNDIVTYSNRIFPQQIISYKRNAHQLPSSASKKSSAASYDVYEIMEILANTDKTNVTITRNANKPAPSGCSVYSHSINANTPGIVSTQLHLQARTYLDSVSKQYAEEAVRLAEEEERLRNEPSLHEQIGKYIKIEHTYSSHSKGQDCLTNQTNNNNVHLVTNSNNSDEELIEQLEEDILSMLKPHESTGHDPNKNTMVARGYNEASRSL